MDNIIELPKFYLAVKREKRTFAMQNLLMQWYTN